MTLVGKYVACAFVCHSLPLTIFRNRIIVIQKETNHIFIQKTKLLSSKLGHQPWTLLQPIYFQVHHQLLEGKRVVVILALPVLVILI